MFAVCCLWSEANWYPYEIIGPEVFSYRDEDVAIRFCPTEVEHYHESEWEGASYGVIDVFSGKVKVVDGYYYLAETLGTEKPHALLLGKNIVIYTENDHENFERYKDWPAVRKKRDYEVVSKSGDEEWWRVTLNSDGTVVRVQDDFDPSVITVVDEQGNIISVHKNDYSSLSQQIANISETGQNKNEVNDIMLASGLDWNGHRGWFADKAEGFYNGKQMIDHTVILGELDVYVYTNGYWERESDIKQEDVEVAGNLPLHSACAITSGSWVNNEFLKSLGIVNYDSDSIISNILDGKNNAFTDKGYVTSWNLLMASYSAAMNMENYLLFNSDAFSSEKEVLEAGYSYYLAKYSHYQNSERTHWVGFANGIKNDPDSTTINRWWENDAQNSVIYYGLTPKF